MEAKILSHINCLINKDPKILECKKRRCLLLLHKLMHDYMVDYMDHYAISVKKYEHKYIQSPAISATFICFSFSFSVSFLITLRLSVFLFESPCQLQILEGCYR